MSHQPHCDGDIPGSPGCICDPEPTVPLANYTAALDEIYALRKALAYEARVVEAHYEGYKTFPKTRRKIAEGQVERMRLAVKGLVHHAYGGIGYWDREFTRVRGSSSMTRHQWETEQGLAP